MTKKRDENFHKLHRTDWQNFLWNRFLEKSPKVADALFSKYEKALIAKRLAALALIRAGVGTREIGRILWMSQATISSLRKNFFGNPRDYKSQRAFKAVKQISPSPAVIKKSWLDQIFEGVDIWELLKNPPRPPGIGLKRRR